MSTIFYIARHGESEGNVNNDIMGMDPPLTPRGMAQASQLRQRFLDLRVDEVHASTLIRAQQTAAYIAHERKLTVVPAPELRERYFGSLEGKMSHLVAERFGDLRREFLTAPLEKQLQWKLVDDEETFSQVTDRGRSFFLKFDTQFEGKTIFAVSRANMMVALLVNLGFAAFAQLPYGSIKNTGCMKIEKQGSQLRLLDVFDITRS